MGEIADFKNGVNYTKGETKYKYLCVGVTNFQESPILQDFDAISTVTLDNQLTEDFLLQEGDILLVRSNGNKRLIGRSMLIFPEDKVMTYSGFCIRCRITSPTVESKYIFYYLQNALIRGLFAKNQQTNINNISQEVLNNIMVFLPNVEIQRKISNLLFFIDSKIALNNRVNATLEAMAKTIYDYWFVQFDFPDEKGRPYKTSGGKMVYNEELGREIPAGWEVRQIGDLLKKVSVPKGLQTSEYKPEGILPIIDQSQQYIVGYTDCTEMECLPDEEEVIVFGDHTCFFKYVNFPFALGADGTQCIVSCDSLQMPQLLLYYSIKDVPLANKGYARHFKFLKDAAILLPNRKTAQSFQQQTKSLYSIIRKNIKETCSLASLRDWLLPMLMNGQVGFKKREEY